MPEYIPQLDDLNELERDVRYRYIDQLIDWTKEEFIEWLRNIRSICQEELDDVARITGTAIGEVTTNGAVEAVIDSLHESANSVIEGLIESYPIAPPVPAKPES